MSNSLFNAALEGQQDVFEQYKADNRNVKWDDIRDDNGNTLIAAAASRGKLHIIEYLESSGASLNIPNNHGRTDVQIAYEDGHPNTTRGLIRLYEKNGIAVPLDDETRKKLGA